jgi:hypothetical protein
MTVRCNQCGHENNPDYRFCGICGAPLSPAVATREPEKARVSPVGGPSFLGLGDDRTTDLDYLLDDEPPRGHGRLYLALFLLVMSAGLLAWHWQRDGYPWAGLIQGTPANRNAVSSVTAPPSAPASTPAAESPALPPGNPAPPETQAATAPITPVPVTPGAGQTPASEAPSEGATDPNAVAAAKPPDQTSDQGNTSGPPEAAAKPATAAPAAGPAAKPAAAPPPEAGEPAASAPSSSTASVTPVRKPSIVKPAPTIPAVNPEDRLVDEGERYLYGRGVRPDCALAQRNLMIGARQSNPKAETLLGAMYATGHCVGRDLPTAYRWFAKALHGDPGNSRVQRDLEVLWKQMTPEERMLAMKSQ